MQTIFKHPDKYGFTTNANHIAVLEEREFFCKEKNIPVHFALSDPEHLELEIRLSEKYRKEFIDFCKSYGSVTTAVSLLEACNSPSLLLIYYYIKKRIQKNQLKIIRKLLPLQGNLFKKAELTESEDGYRVNSIDESKYFPKTEDDALIKALCCFYNEYFYPIKQKE